MRIHARSGIAPALVAVLIVVAAGCGSPLDGGGRHAADYLDADAIYVGASTMRDPREGYDDLLALMRQMVGDEFQEVEDGIASWEKQSGVSVRDGLLALFEGEMGFSFGVDDLDGALPAAQAAATNPMAIEPLLTGILMVVGTPDAERFNENLGKALGTVGLAVESRGDLRAIGLPGAPVEILYRHHDGYVLLGLTEGALEAAVSRADEGHGFGRSAAFREILDVLGPDPEGVAYLNLPRLHALLEGSSLLRGALEMQGESPGLYRALVPEKPWAEGIAWASYRVRGGRVSKTFTPESDGSLVGTFLAGGATGGGIAVAGITAAIAVPNLLHAIDRGGQKRTMADMRAIATACESYAIDNNRYPEPHTDDFVTVELLRQSLEPRYIRSMPIEDGWESPFVYWSDGKDYAILSAGKDGRRDWSLRARPAGATSSLDADIVFRSGNFVQYPEGPQS